MQLLVVLLLLIICFYFLLQGHRDVYEAFDASVLTCCVYVCVCVCVCVLVFFVSKIHFGLAHHSKPPKMNAEIKILYYIKYLIVNIKIFKRVFHFPVKHYTCRSLHRPAFCYK